MQPEQKRARARALKPADYERWRGHPVTEVFLGYLTDYVAMIRESWSAGSNWTDEARLRVQEREDIVNLKLENIQEFYSESSEGEDSGSPDTV